MRQKKEESKLMTFKKQFTKSKYSIAQRVVLNYRAKSSQCLFSLRAFSTDCELLNIGVKDMEQGHNFLIVEGLDSDLLSSERNHFEATGARMELLCRSNEGTNNGQSNLALQNRQQLLLLENSD